MSRWINNFENHAFKTTWEDLKAKLELSEVDETVATSVDELARLKKVVAFIDNGLEGFDPELVSNLDANILNTWNQQATECRNQIVNYNTNKNIGHITNANNNVDNLLNYIRPHILYPDKLKKSLLASIRAYTNEVDKHLNQITDTKTEYNKVKEFREKIEEYYDLLFQDDDEDKSIKLQISTLLERAEEQYREINGFYNETLNDTENESTKTTVNEAKKDILRDVDDANEKLVNVSAKIEKLDKFYINIFGSEDEDGNRKGGLEKELTQRIEALENFKIEQEKVYAEEMKSRLASLKKYEQEQQSNNKNMYEQIESLLPGATSAGLAKAYQDMKDSFWIPTLIWNIVFIIILLGMFLGSAYTLGEIKDYKETLNHFFHYLPLYVPGIWLAIYASKRRSESKRLQQEYAHKEAMAKSYVSYKMQIDELKQEDKQLLEKLLNSSIDTVSHNASESLDKNHGDPTPVQETIKMFVEQVAKLKG